MRFSNTVVHASKCEFWPGVKINPSCCGPWILRPLGAAIAPTIGAFNGGVKTDLPTDFEIFEEQSPVLRVWEEKPWLTLK